MAQSNQPLMPIDASLYAKVWTSLTPADNEEDLSTIAKEQAERLKAALMDEADRGFGPLWDAEDSRTRYDQYMAATYPEDLYIALDPDFKADRLAGKNRLILKSEELIQQRMQYEQMGMQMESQGIPAPPLPPDPHTFWGLIAELPDYSWRHWSRDFSRLHNAELARKEAEIQAYWAQMLI